MGKSPQTIMLQPRSRESRLESLSEVRQNSKGTKESLVVRLSLFEGPRTIKGREHRITRYEAFTYSRGELVHFTFFDSEIWDTMTSQERFLIEKGHQRQREER